VRSAFLVALAQLPQDQDRDWQVVEAKSTWLRSVPQGLLLKNATQRTIMTVRVEYRNTGADCPRKMDL
jgi:hypothetical protein